VFTACGIMHGMMLPAGDLVTSRQHNFAISPTVTRFVSVKAFLELQLGKQLLGS